MPKIAAIICEYNPFHLGHEYQIKEIRRQLGDICVVGIMSGNVTQRGEFAFADKYIRAEAAVYCGADLILELPYPYSCASAEYFSSAGVKIADSIGADYLCFGSESGDIYSLEKISEILNDSEFIKILSYEALRRENENRGYAEIRSDTLKKYIKQLYSKKNHGENINTKNNIYSREICENSMHIDFDIIDKSNDILALEYMSAIKRQKSSLIPVAVKRKGAGYNDSDETEGYMSASGIRLLSENNFKLIRKFMPDKSYEVFEGAVKNKKAPVDERYIDSAVLSFFRLNLPENLSEYAEMTGGIEYRLAECASKSISVEEFYERAATKRYTNAKIRRIIKFAMTGVRQSDLKKLPEYTVVLAANERGRALLKQIKKTEKITVITKPSSYRDYSDIVKTQFELSLQADALFTLCLPERKPAGEYLRKTPIII